MIDTNKRVYLLMSRSTSDEPICILAADRQLTHQELMETKMLDFEDEAIECDLDPYMLMDEAFESGELEWKACKLFAIPQRKEEA